MRRIRAYRSRSEGLRTALGIITLLLCYGAGGIVVRTEPGAGMWVLLVALPLVAFATGLLCPNSNRVGRLFPGIAALGFALVALLALNESALVYAIAYGFIALIAQGVAALGRRLLRNRRR